LWIQNHLTRILKNCIAKDRKWSHVSGSQTSNNFFPGKSNITIMNPERHLLVSSKS
jgi:hypothetical protein